MTVEQCYGVVKEAVSEPAGTTPKAPVTSPRREHRGRDRLVLMSHRRGETSSLFSTDRDQEFPTDQQIEDVE